MLDQIFTTIVASIILGILVPVVYLGTMKALPIQGLNGLYLLVGVGVLMGIILGFLFPKLARWFLENLPWS